MGKCECAGGCCMWSFGYHPAGKTCKLAHKPGLPARTMENSRQRIGDSWDNEEGRLQREEALRRAEAER